MEELRGFEGSFSEVYDYYKYITPNRLAIIDRIAEIIFSESAVLSGNITVLDIGCGFGNLSKSILEKSINVNIIAIEDKGFMLRQAKKQLIEWVNKDALSFMQKDFLEGVKTIESGSISFVVSSNVIHNLHKEYRSNIYNEVYRILRPDGLFLNGDLIALDDEDKNTEMAMARAKYCINSLIALNRVEYISKWVMHFIKDLNPNIIMKEIETINELKDINFKDI